MSGAPAPFRPLAKTMDARRQQVEQLDLIQGGLFRVSAFIEVDGAGEGLAHIDFPVRFVEKPAFFHGGELLAGQEPIAGNMPSYSAIVYSWSYHLDTSQGNRTGKRFFTGADIVVVTTGEASLKMIVHVHMEGQALR